jgi:membrane fusion protein (multidrug efflux system)
MKVLNSSMLKQRVGTLLLSSLMGLLVLSLGCSKKAPVAPKPTVQVTSAIQQDVAVFTEATGQLQGALNVEVRAKVDGFLQSMPIKEGQKVKKGELLFTIDSRTPAAAVDQAKGALARAQAAWDKAKADVARYKPLAASQAISQQELDNALSAERSAKATYDSAKADVTAASVNLGYTKVTAPMDGIVGTTGVNPGALVTANTLLTTISQTDRMKIEVAFPERDYIKYAEKINQAATRDIKQVEKNGKAELLLSDGSVYAKKGWVETVDRAIDASTGTLKIRLMFPNPEGTLRPGQFGKIRGSLDQLTGAILIPQRAVQEIQGSFNVAVVGADNKVELRSVKAGARTGTWWVISEGLKAGEKVVVEGIQKVRNGVEVEPQPAAAEPLPPVPSNSAAAPAPTPAPGK